MTTNQLNIGDSVTLDTGLYVVWDKTNQALQLVPVKTVCKQGALKNGLDYTRKPLLISNKGVK